MVTNAIVPLEGFRFGADPELFLQTENGEYVSAEGLLPGTKSEPFKVERGAVQVDGMAAEFNIDAAETFDDFNKNIVTVLKQLQGMLPKGIKLVPLPAVEFSKAVWDVAPDKAKELGCTPDFNAWTGEVNPPPENTKRPRLRTASGHLHIGWTENASTADIDHIENCRDLVKQLDWYLGGWSLQVDPDPIRRLLYGKAGACRFKPYGVEYRVLSNFWVMDGARRRVVWDRMQTALHDMRSNFMPSKNYKFTETLIETINMSSRNADLEVRFPYPFRTLVKKG